MAFGAKKIFPIDTKPGTAVGIAIPFNAPNVFFQTYTTQDAIKNNLLNFFLTNKNLMSRHCTRKEQLVSLTHICSGSE